MTDTTTAANLIDLRATLAMRVEDTWIARKHEQAAAARIGTPENVRAWRSASDWLATCVERERIARSAVICANIEKGVV